MSQDAEVAPDESVTVTDDIDTEPAEEGPSLPDILTEAQSLYDDLMSGHITLGDIEQSHTLEEINHQLDLAKDDLKKSRTSKLWLQYLDMISLLQEFIRAELTGNWKMHLSVMWRMLPFLAASGHNHYTKSLHLYMQKMDKLEEQHPEVHQHFLNGYHVVRRSDKY